MRSVRVRCKAAATSTASVSVGIERKLFPVSRISKDGTERSMNLVVWLPAMFVLGLASLGVCYAFIFACEVI
jgi:hypothetical protein